MSKRRMLLRGSLGFFAIMLVAVVGVWLWLRASLPKLSGEIHGAGLAEPVRVVRDRRGVPSINARSDSDAFFALGFVHAQDRFWEMELSRRVISGHLAELIGDGGIQVDRNMRKFGLRRAAERSIASLLPETRAILDAYSAGINAWLNGNSQRLPAEFEILRLRGGPARPSPWEPADSIAILKGLSLLLDGNYEEELLEEQLSEKLGRERARWILAPSEPWGAGSAIVHDEQAVTQHTQRARSADDEETALTAADPALEHARELASLFGAGKGIGSNSWVISGKKTKSGHPLLSNDPHLAVQSPSEWYAARIEAPGLHVSGATLPGIPAIVVGRNARIAWGITAMHADVQDLFFERVDPKDARFYIVGDRREPFVVRDEEIRIVGQAAPIHVQVRSTRHGPVIEDDWRGHGPLALSWIALAEDDTSLDALLAFDHAANWTEFLAAAHRVVAPVVNFTYADTDGHIGYLGPGLIPVRALGDGSRPLDGSLPDAVWKSYIPFDELPRVLDPEEGYIVSANQTVAGPGYHHFLARQFAAPFRALRIRQLLTAQDKLDADDLPRLHADVTSVGAQLLLPRMTALKPKDPREVAALQLLGGWSGTLSGDSAAAMLYTAWRLALAHRIFDDELEKTYAAELENILAALDEPEQRWCDDERTIERETCDDALTRSLTEAVARLTRAQGSDPTKWRLDRALRLSFESKVMSAVPLLRTLYTRELADWGDSTTVRVALVSDDFDVWAISTFFGDYDLGPSGGARFGVVPGQGSHPLGPHFDDLIECWKRSEAPPLDPPEAGGESHLSLLP